MLLRRRRTAVMDDDDPNVLVEPGPSLAKGPALLVGSILVAFGLTGLLQNSDFPNFSSSFPDGTVQGSSWLGFEVNGWTCFFAITAGALLLFGAAQHHLAKMMSLIVGAALVACAVIAIIDGQDVLGLAAANFWTKLGFAVAGGAMLINALMPRTTRRRHIDELRPSYAPGTAAAGTATGASAVVGDRMVDRDRDGIDDRDEPATTVHRRGRFGRRVIDRDAADRDLAEEHVGTTPAARDDVPPPRA